MKRSLAVLVLAATCAASGCRERLANNKCQEDSECGTPASAYRCEAQTGVCYCRTNDACQPREFCNLQGFCQDRAGCEKTADCLDPTLFCDTTSGTCLSKGRCTQDLHCALGQVCDLQRNSCIDGCRTSGDCPGSSCRCGEVACGCTATTAADLAKCTLGVCDPDFCADSTFCKYGELCGVVPDAGNPRAQCYSDFDEVRRPYCSNCTSGGGIETCGQGANYCIIDTRNQDTYCGADCSEGQACPRGYGCRDIIVVFTRWQCGGSLACQPDPTLPCTQDSDCKRGGTCVKAAGAPTGACQAACRLREGSSVGFCGCQQDSDCAQESCSAGECTISRRKCVTEADCRPIRCVDFNGSGGCLIGQNCTPTAGLTCVEVR